MPISSSPRFEMKPSLTTMLVLFSTKNSEGPPEQRCRQTRFQRHGSVIEIVDAGGQIGGGSGGDLLRGVGFRRREEGP
ncbi:hypothetical protein E2542_SST12611 [Spatholobus suberectus]|nr:hypothetical protein E2542_SST12611 [Spatholobus suberectus]